MNMHKNTKKPSQLFTFRCFYQHPFWVKVNYFCFHKILYRIKRGDNTLNTVENLMKTKVIYLDPKRVFLPTPFLGQGKLLLFS